jgi:hypothetical protein
MAQRMMPIPGTTKPQRLENNFASRNVVLSDEDIKGLRSILDSLKPEGETEPNLRALLAVWSGSSLLLGLSDLAYRGIPTIGAHDSVARERVRLASNDVIYDTIGARAEIRPRCGL